MVAGYEYYNGICFFVVLRMPVMFFTYSLYVFISASIAVGTRFVF